MCNITHPMCLQESRLFAKKVFKPFVPMLVCKYFLSDIRIEELKDLLTFVMFSNIISFFSNVWWIYVNRNDWSMHQMNFHENWFYWYYLLSFSMLCLCKDGGAVSRVWSKVRQMVFQRGISREESYLGESETSAVLH